MDNDIEENFIEKWEEQSEEKFTEKWEKQPKDKISEKQKTSLRGNSRSMGGRSGDDYCGEEYGDDNGGWRMSVGKGDDCETCDDECRSRTSMVVCCGDRFGDKERVEDGHEGDGRWR